MAEPAVAQQQFSQIAAIEICKSGQENVHELIARVLDLFNTFKIIMVSEAASFNPNEYEKQRKRFLDSLTAIKSLFQKLREQIALSESFSSNQNIEAYQSELNAQSSQEQKQELATLRNQLADVRSEMGTIINNLRDIVWSIDLLTAQALQASFQTLPPSAS